MYERKWDLDLIRIIACFFVVVVHVAGYGMELKEPASGDWMIRNITACLVRCAVPIFFMLSGILFMEKEISLKVLYRKYIFRLTAAWVVWSAFYAAIDFIAALRDGEASFGHFIFRFVSGHYHLWFLPSLLVAYLFLPIIQRLVWHCPSRLMLYLGGIVLFGIILKETLDPFIHSEVWDGVWNNLSIPGGSAGIIYFVLGYYLYKNKDRFKRGICLAVYLGNVCLMAVINMLCAWMRGAHVTVTYGYLSLGVLVSSAAFFMFLCGRFSRIQFGEKTKRVVRQISDCTFGIYLVHTFLIEQVYRRIHLTQEQFSTVVSLILFSTLTFALSYLITWCIRRIPVIGKIIV